MLLVAARDGTGAGLYQVAGDAPGLSRAVMPAIDATRKLARLGFRAVPARLLGPPQVLGGTGFTWEHPAHPYFRRARTSAVLFGTETAQRATLADRLGL